MTVLLKRQVAAQTHSPAVRQHSSWHLGASGRAGSLHFRKQEPGRAPKGKAVSKASLSSAGGHQSTAPCSAPSPWAGELRPRVGQEEFLPPGEFNAGSRTLPPMAGCLPVLLLWEQPTHLWGRPVLQGWAVPRGGLSPGFYRVASKCNSPPDRVCQSKLGLDSSEPAYRCLGENLVFLKDKWGLHLRPLLNGAG